MQRERDTIPLLNQPQGVSPRFPIEPDANAFRLIEDPSRTASWKLTPLP
jgi:hypothetical protein